MKVNVFLSWSGEVSKRIAAELKPWLPTVLHAEPFFSVQDLAKGKAWREGLADRLLTFPLGIIILTPQNVGNPSAFMMFEAGALWKPAGPGIDTSICTLLVGVNSTDVVGPLADVQHTRFERDDFFLLMQRINKDFLSPEDRHSDETLRRAFDSAWPRLDEQVRTILEDASRAGGTPPVRDQADMIEELVERARETQNQVGIINDQLKAMRPTGAIAVSEHVDFVRIMLWTLHELAMKINQEPGGIHTRVVTRCGELLGQLERYAVALDISGAPHIQQALHAASSQLNIIVDKARATEAKEAAAALNAHPAAK